MKTTSSLCPVCLKKIPAEYIEKKDRIYLEKTCDAHGFFSTLVCEDIGFFSSLDDRPLANIQADSPIPSSEKGCPYDCGICENHKQKTCCVLLEVTQACNLKCPICFADAGLSAIDDPSLDEISCWYDSLMNKGGPFNIQLSGGEPTMRDDLQDIIKLGKGKGFSFFQLNTNGLRIAEDYEYLEGLKSAGLSTVFLQFDGFEENTYQALRGKNLLETKKKAIDNCKKTNIGVVLVPTLKKDLNDGEIGEIISFAIKHMPVVRGVHFQPLSFFGRYGEHPDNHSRMTLFQTAKELEKQTDGQISVDSLSFGGAEHYYCSFSGNYLLEDGKLSPVHTNTNNCCSSAQSQQVVARKWKYPPKPKKSSSYKNTASLDEFINKMQRSTLMISSMAFQDAWNVDLERLQRCYIQTIAPSGKLIPFCSYNITSTSGKSLYRK